jgi:hypothetical protein
MPELALETVDGQIANGVICAIYEAVDVKNGYFNIRRKADGMILTVNEHNQQSWQPPGTYAPHQNCSITGGVATYWPTGEIAVKFLVAVRP